MDPVFLVIELSAAVCFLAATGAALRRGRLPFLELTSAAAFGLLLEQGNQLVYETYEYAPGFALAIDRAPVVIGLAWALIIASAMRITDALGVRARYAPAVDSLLAIMLDLAFDAVAIRMGLWTWREIGPADGWFGVPAGNFYAWLFVVMAFSALTRALRPTAAKRPTLEWLQLAVPLAAWPLLLAAIVPFSIVKPLVDPAPGGGLSLFAAALLATVGLSAWAVFGPDRRSGAGEVTIVDLRLAFFVRLAIHALFLVALVALGIPRSEPLLLVVALGLLALEAPLAWLVRARRQPRPVAIPTLIA